MKGEIRVKKDIFKIESRYKNRARKQVEKINESKTWKYREIKEEKA